MSPSRRRAGKQRDLDTARQWGRELLKTHELLEFTTTDENSVLPVIGTTEVQADAQPRKMSISGIMNTAIQAGIIAPAGGGGSPIAAGSGIYITQSGDIQVINSTVVSASGISIGAGSGIYLTQGGSVVNVNYQEVYDEVVSGHFLGDGSVTVTYSGDFVLVSGTDTQGVAAGSGIYITQSGGLQVINAEETLVSGIAAGSGIYITQSGGLQVINAEDGGGSSASGIAAGSGIYITQSGGLQVINAEETLVSGVAAGSGIYITQSGGLQVINNSIYSVGDLSDVETTTVPPSGRQALVWDEGDSQFEPTSVVNSNTTGISGSNEITNMVSLTQAQYDAIVTPDSATFYIITA